jgi:hypothetical protein
LLLNAFVDCKIPQKKSYIFTQDYLQSKYICAGKYYQRFTTTTTLREDRDAGR